VKIEPGAKGPIAGPDFVLPKAALLLVKVLDAKGQPQAGAIVSFSSSEDQFWPATQRTEADGTVKLTSLTPDQSYIIAARTPGTFSERKTVKAPFKTPLVLRLNPNGGTRLKGRVLSQDGKPIAGAKVQIIANRGRSSGSDTNLVTDKNGNFLSEALWPDAKFSTFVTAANHIPAKSGAWQGEAGQTHDFGTLKLQHLAGVIQGQVRDKNGQPLSGARVWVRAALSQGSGNKTEALSDSQGRFRIEGLPDAPFFIFTQKEGEPLGAAWHSSPKGQRDFIVTIGEYHGSVRPSRSQAEQDAAARRVTLRYLDKALKQVKTQKGDNATYQMSNLLGWLARLDAPRAIQLAAPQGDTRDRLSMTLGTLALKKSPPDITTALARWNSTKEPTYRAFSLAIALRGNVKSRPDLARQLVPATLTAARAVPEVSYRVIMLAKVGEALNLLQSGSGDALLSEATATVKQLGANDYEGYARAEVAECIVDKQPDVALALLEPVKDINEKARYYGEIAYRLARRDPERAIKLIKDNLDEGNQGQRLAGLCHALATKDLPKAESLAATLKGQNKLNALRWMAEALAPTQRDEALRLWRTALDNAGTENYDEPYSSGQSASEMMLFIGRGREWGAPDVQGRALQALANRPQREVNYWEMDDYNLRQEAQYALLLYLADQDLARDYTQSLFPLFAKKKGKLDSYMMEPMVLLTLVTAPSLTDQILRDAPAANLPSYTSVALQWVLGTPEERQKQLRRSVWIAEPFEDD
ncbi:MAG TPA: carboxypeptidase regulatory-like domain-containing protein, partial [Abditibacteriaceae bacterium]